MLLFSTAFSRFSTVFRRFRTGSAITLLVLAGVAGYSVFQADAYRLQGIYGATQKSNNPGCTCHCSSSNSSTTVQITTSATSFQTGQSYTFTVTVSNSTESRGGVNVAAYVGSLTAGTGLQSNGSELSHNGSQALPASWSFTYTAPSYAVDDTIYATGNAVDNDQSSDNGACWDKWNFAPKYVVHVVAPYQPKRFSIARTSINLGQVRVGTRKSDTTKLTSTGTFNLPIYASTMKAGGVWTTNSQNGTGSRTFNAGTTEVDTVIFIPTARGTVNDSLIFTTGSDTLPDQRKGLAVTAQGIQAIFSNTATSLAYGTVKLSAPTPTKAFIYSNTGDDTLFLTGQPSVSGASFSVSKQANRLALPPGANDSVVVQFAPTARQTYNGTLSFTASNGVTAPSIPLSGSGMAPQMQANATSAVGSSRVGTPMQGIYTIKNIGNDTLHIASVSLIPASGSKFTLGNYDAIVLPNATGSFHVTYTPTAEKTDSVQIHFSTDDATYPSYSALITANGTLPHMSIDTATVNIGETKLNSSITHDFPVVNNGGSDLTLNTTVEGDAPFSLQSSPQSVQAGSTGYVTVKFMPTSAGSFKGRLIISGDDAANPRDTINFTASGTNSALTITPSVANFNYVPVGITAYDTLKLSNTGNAAVKILSYKFSGLGMSAFAAIDTSTHQVAPSGSGRIILSFKPTDVTGYSASLILTTDEANPTHTITIGGAGIKGALTPNPTVLDFGMVDTGNSKTLSTTLKNTGSAPITISTLAINPSSNVFSYVATPTVPTTVKPNDSVVVNITFTPHAAGFVSAGLKLTTDDGTSGNIITFGGTGNITQQNNSVADHTIAGLHLAIVPNPAHAVTTCMLTLDQPQTLRMIVIDALGREVVVKNLGMLGTGEHALELPIAQLPAGNYFVRLLAENGSMESKLVIER